MELLVQVGIGNKIVVLVFRQYVVNAIVMAKCLSSWLIKKSLYKGIDCALHKMQLKS